jgi:hypothetical protein
MGLTSPRQLPAGAQGALLFQKAAQALSTWTATRQQLRLLRYGSVQYALILLETIEVVAACRIQVIVASPFSADNAGDGVDNCNWLLTPHGVRSSTARHYLGASV